MATLNLYDGSGPVARVGFDETDAVERARVFRVVDAWAAYMGGEDYYSVSPLGPEDYV